MKTFRAIATAAALSVASISVAASAGPKATTKAPKVSARAPKNGPQAPKASTKAPKSAASASKAIDGPKAGKAIGASKKSRDTTAPSTTAATTTPTATMTTVAEPNAVSTKISGNPEQLARIKPMLPEGLTLEQATAGFRNQGQFIAALNAAKNNGVKFVDLQKAMTVDGLSLGQAVKQLKAAPAPAPTTPTTTPTTTTGGSGGGSL